MAYFFNSQPEPSFGTGLTQTNYYSPYSYSTPSATPEVTPTTNYGSNPSFNLNPSPQAGAGTFGAVPGAIGMPNPSADLASVYPNLSGTNRAISGNIMSGLMGQLSPGTVNAIQNATAAWGLSNGIPGSGLQQNVGATQIGKTSEALQQQALQNYNQTVPTISSTQTVSPTLQTEIAATNAQNAAAPNPTASASYAQELFNQYLSRLSGPAGGTGYWESHRRGTGVPTGDIGIPSGMLTTSGTGGPGTFGS